MKIKYFAFLLLLGATTLAGCQKYLDIVPDERPTEKDAFKDIYAAENFLYSCYAPLPNPRQGTVSIDLFTTDEVVTAFEHETFAQFPKGTFTASNPVISYWSTLYKGIRQCYILIENIDKTPGLSDEKKALYKAEAKFLVGYYHFLLARMYGPIIIQQGVADVAMDFSSYPSRAPYEECVTFITNMLDEAAAGLPPRPISPNEYGRATSIAAKSIKARMLLYAASPLFNGGGGEQPSLYSGFKGKDGKDLIPTVYDREKWKKAAEAAKEAIALAESNGHQLYHYNSSVNSELPASPVEKDLRFVFIDKNSPEVIFADTRREGIYDFQNKSTPFIQGTSWNGIAPTLTMVEQFYTKNGLPIDKDPDFDFAGRYSIATGPDGATMAVNLNREPRFNAWVAYHNSYYEIVRGSQKQVLMKFRKNDAHGIQGRSNNFSPTGYLNKKGVHPLLVQDQLSVTQHYPWPVVRLAELYLNYAEALIEYGEDLTTAKSYIDRVRTRAGIPTIDAAWANIGGANDKATLREIVRQERTIEFYLENQRFWDLRRWMIAEQYFDVKAKGMNIQGAIDADFFKVTEVVYPRNFRAPAFYLMPIPIGELNKNENLVQNPGY
jgi:starch-binding outer membrane protein, SusD/RagB family